MSESRVTWSTSAPTLVFLGLCSRIRPDVRDRQTSRKTKALLNASALPAVPRSTQPSTLRGTVNEYQLSG